MFSDLRSQVGNQRRISWPPSPTTCVVLHAAAVSIPCLLAAFTDSPDIPLTVGGAIIFVAYLFLAAAEASRSPLLITPLSFYFTWYSISLGLSPIHLANKMNQTGPLDFSTALIPPEYLLAGYLTFLVGSVALHIGIQLIRPKAQGDNPKLHRPTATAQTLLFGIWLFSIVTRLAWEPLSFLGGLRGLFSTGSLAAVCLLALDGRDPRARTGRFYLLLVVGMAGEFLMNVLSGSKAYIMYTFLPVVWLLLSAKRLRALLLPVGAVLTAFYLVVVAPVVTTARETTKQSGESDLSHMAGVYQQGDYVEKEGQFAKFLERQFDPTPVGFIHAEVERFGFRYGETLDYLAFAFVPRFLWPEKPYVTRGAWFTMYLGAASSEAEATSSTGQTAVGELYWNFGIPGVILGMLGLGLFVGGQWRMAGVFPEADPVRFLIYVSLVLTMPDMPEAGTSLVAGVYRVLVFFVLLRIAAGVQQLESRGEAGVAL